jgi:uncharacterized membrane protein
MTTSAAPETGAPSDNTSLLGVLEGLRRDGYAIDLRPGSRDATLRCDGCGDESPVEAFRDLQVRRLEGASDPDDMLVAVGGRCPRCGRGGNVVLGYGPNSSDVDAAIVAGLPLESSATPDPVAADAELDAAPTRLARSLGGWSMLDPVAERVAGWWGRLPEPTLDQLRGRALGHPLHPVATDLPIGFWTSAWVLDLVGGKRSRRASRLLVGLGVASALPTVATGLTDFLQLDRAGRRIGVVHASANAAATALYAASFVARGRSHRRGVALGHLAAACATAGGFLGGHLAFEHQGDDDGSEAPRGTGGS